MHTPPPSPLFATAPPLNHHHATTTTTTTATTTTTQSQLGLDDYGVIRAVNFARREVAAGRDPLPALRAAAAAGPGGAAAWPWAGDEFLAPALPDDPLLGYDYDEAAADAGCARRKRGAVP